MKSLYKLIHTCSERNIEKKLTYMENEFIKLIKFPTGEHFTLKRNLKCFEYEFKK